MRKKLRLSHIPTSIFVLIGILLLVVACEPLAPDDQSQQVIVVTATPLPSPRPSATPPFVTALPTRVEATVTPTIATRPTVSLPPCEETEGRVLDATFTSTIMENEVPYRMYLPPCFFITGQRYPYVILLHGSTFDQTQWTDGLAVQTVMDEQLADPLNPLPPMVLVMPYGDYLMQENIFDEGASYENVILDELVPTVESQYCLWSNREGRAIGGISRGGFWSVSIAFRHQDLFSAAGGHSPVFDDDLAPPLYDPLQLAETLPPTTQLRIYLDVTQSDIAEANVTGVSNILRLNGVEHTYEIS
ncbi:partial Endo-1,4-beta-xylanase Z, partial [Anaerolineae bacterium]